MQLLAKENWMNFYIIGQEVKLELSNFKLNAFMASVNLSTYYHYMGSLTTPKCEQTVTWNVMSPMYAIPVTEAQVGILNL